MDYVTRQKSSENSENWEVSNPSTQPATIGSLLLDVHGNLGMGYNLSLVPHVKCIHWKITEFWDGIC